MLSSVTKLCAFGLQVSLRCLDSCLLFRDPSALRVAGIIRYVCELGVFRECLSRYRTIF